MTETDLISLAVDALAKMEEPKFQREDNYTIEIVFVPAFYQGGSAWFDNFKQRVAERSGGLVSMNDVAAADYPNYPVKGPARYFVLVNSQGRRVYGHFGPYLPPFELQL